MWNQTIIKAVTSLKLIKLTYDGQIRLVEPHLLGYKNHELDLLAWQLKNESEIGNQEGWWTFQVRKITDIEISDQHFNGTRFTKTHDRSKWSRILAVVN